MRTGFASKFDTVSNLESAAVSSGGRSGHSRLTASTPLARSRQREVAVTTAPALIAETLVPTANFLPGHAVTNMTYSRPVKGVLLDFAHVRLCVV